MSHAAQTASTTGLVNQKGFTLLEMAAVLTIIAVIIAGTISMGSSMVASAQLVNTNNKLDAIETALMAYRVANNRLPCPADPTVVEGGSNYGYEAGTAGTCTASNISSYTIPNSSTDYAARGITATEGAVPVRTLNLPDEYQVDGWGRKFAYAVAAPMTGTNAFITYGLYANCGALSVENAGGSYRSQVADYTLLSYGPNGHGGYLKTGSRYFMGSDNAAEQTNCHCNTSADTGYAATYVQQDPTQTSSSDSLSVFDDIVRYKERWQMQNAYDTYQPNSQIPCASTSTGAGTNGFVINGVNALDMVGASVAVGDVNGDGIPDLVIGAASSGTTRVYVVFGTRQGFPDPLPLSSLNGTNGFALAGTTSALPGISVAVGDVNGDGVADIIIGSPGAGSGDNGSVYVVFGGPTRKDGSPWSTCPCTLSAGSSNFLNGTNGAEFDAAAVNYLVGSSVSTGDVNGDGIADLIIGAPGVNSSAGAVYVVFGKTGTWSSSATTLTSGSNPLDGTHGAEFDGAAANYYVGHSVATGDVNGDGIADLIIGAYGATVNSNASAGAVYVVFGKTSTWSSASTLTSGTNPLDGKNGAEFDGAAAGNELGLSVATGDVNHDGIADLIIGAPDASPGSHAGAGAVYVIFGKSAGTWSSATTLTSGSNPLDGTHGAEFDGAATSYVVGSSVATGDVNGDGIPDLIIGASGVNSTVGAVYVVFGKTGAWSSATTLTSGSNPLDGTHGAEVDGAAGNNIGRALATGDINGNGIPDLVIGDSDANSTAGAVYIYNGRTSGWPSSAYSVGGL